MEQMPESLISMLDEIDQRCGDIERSMNDPEIASNGLKVVALARERARLDRIVSPYREYKQLVSRFQEARELIDDSDSDPELKELAEAEVEEVSGSLQAVIEKIKELLVMSDDGDIDSIISDLEGLA